MMNFEAPKSSGCQVTWEDVPRICASVSGFGAGMSALGASIHEFAVSIDVNDTSMGRMFVYRGIGFLLGAVLSMRILRIESLHLSKHAICSILAIIAGSALAFIPVFSTHISQYDGSNNENKWLWTLFIGILFFIQGFCFGGIDAFSALSISEMWGQRTQPWMQSKNLFANFGALLGPSLVSSYGYDVAFMLIGALGLFSIVGLGLYYINIIIRTKLGLPLQDTDLTSQELREITHQLLAMQDDEEENEEISETFRDKAVEEEDERKVESDLELALSPRARLHLQDDLVFRVLEDTHYARSHSNMSSPVGRAPTVSFDFTMPTVFSPRRRLGTQDSTYSALTANSMHSIGEDSSGMFPALNHTLSFASPTLARRVRRTRKPVGIVFVPMEVRLLLALLVFWQLGLLCAFGGWIGTYVGSLDEPSSVLLTSVQHSSVYAVLTQQARRRLFLNAAASPDPAASALTIFYATQILGGVLSVPASVVFSTSTLLRWQLVMAVVAAALLLIPALFLPSVTMAHTVVQGGAGLMGLGLGCMYPLIMTIVNDYGATMTSNSTIAVVLGGCIGEAIAPFLVAVAIARCGPSAFAYSTAGLIAALALTYLALHWYLKYTASVHFSQKAEQALELSQSRQSSPVHMPRRNYSRSSIASLLSQGSLASPPAASHSYQAGLQGEVPPWETLSTYSDGTCCESPDPHEMELVTLRDDAAEYAPLTLSLPVGQQASRTGDSGPATGESLSYKSCQQGSSRSSPRVSPRSSPQSAASGGSTGRRATGARSLYSQSFQIGPLLPAQPSYGSIVDDDHPL